MVPVFGLAAVVWSAANDHALVVDSFSVPSDLAAQGETGAVIAAHVMDAVATMENQTTSFRAKSSYQNDWSNDIKVQIPDTGVNSYFLTVFGKPDPTMICNGFLAGAVAITAPCA